MLSTQDAACAHRGASSSNIDFGGVTSFALNNAKHLLFRWFPAGRVRGREFKIGNRCGDPGNSLSVTIDTREWSDFATLDKRGSDLISLNATRLGVTQTQSAEDIVAELGADIGSPRPVVKVVSLSARPPKKDDWHPIVPVPTDAPPRPTRQRKPILIFARLCDGGAA